MSSLGWRSLCVALALALSALSAPALAQKRPKRPSKPPSAAAPVGTAKEEPPVTPAEAPLPVPPYQSSEADAALLRALLWAFEPAPREIRVIAILDLALLGDPRALDSLATLTRHPDRTLARAALDAVTHFQHPRADEILREVVRSPTLPEAMRVAAVEALPFQDSDVSRALLAELSRSGPHPNALRLAARVALAKMTQR